MKMKIRIYTLVVALMMISVSANAQNKIATTLSVTVKNANYMVDGDDARVEVTLKDVNENGVSGIVSIGVKGDNDYDYDYKYNNVAVVGGTGTYIVSNLASDSYTIQASFAGDDNYAASTTAEAYSFYVAKITTGLDISLDKETINVGEKATVSITLNRTGFTTAQGGTTLLETPDVLSNNAVVVLGVDDSEAARVTNPAYFNVNVALVNGKGSFNISGLAAGTYYLKGVFAGDDNYVQNESSVLTLTVIKNPTNVGVEVEAPVIAKEENNNLK